MEREPNTVYVASISHGKDSNAMLHVIKDILDYPLDYITTVDVWFDENLRAELPPMVEWKEEADRIILEKFGIPVTHLYAMRGGDGYLHKMVLHLSPKEQVWHRTYQGISKHKPLLVQKAQSFGN